MSQNFFNLNDETQGTARKLAEGMHTRLFTGENIMLSVLRVAPGTVGEMHSHPEEQWGLVLEGSGIRIQDGVETPVAAGDFWYTQGGLPHGFRTGENGALVLDIFSPPRSGFRESGEGFGASTASGSY